jgi:intein/homing endonuclease
MQISSDLIYLIGFIYGDGYIKDGPKSSTDSAKDYKIGVEISDIEFLKKVIKPLFQKFTNTKAKIIVRKREGKKLSGILEVRNKKIYLFLAEKLKTHKGAKTNKLDITKTIKNLPLYLKNEFLAGFFDADGGNRGNTIGFTSSSKYVRDFLCEILTANKIKYYKDSWNNKKYNRMYYGFKIKRDNIDIFLNIINLRNNQKLARSFALCTGAGVVKRAGKK